MTIQYTENQTFYNRDCQTNGSYFLNLQVRCSITCSAVQFKVKFPTPIIYNINVSCPK